jgi:DNA-binding MurR/RpiR family transcriptional regulator
VREPHNAPEDARGRNGEHAPNVFVTIRARAPELSPAERRVSKAVLADPIASSAKTISELAQAASTSETTVVRFAQALGFSGYPELRLALAGAAAAERVQSKRSVPGGDITADDDLRTLASKVGYSNMRAVQETVEQIDQATLSAAVDRLVAARRIDIYGAAASAIVALDLQMKLHRIGRASFAWADHHVAVPSAALLTRHDVAIGISHSGATQDTIDALGEAHSHGATTIALTNFPGSPITAVSDLVLTTAAREATFRSGAIGSRIAALTLVDCLFVAVAQRNLPATQRALERTFAAAAALSDRSRGTRKAGSRRR